MPLEVLWRVQSELEAIVDQSSPRRRRVTASRAEQRQRATWQGAARQGERGHQSCSSELSQQLSPMDERAVAGSKSKSKSCRGRRRHGSVRERERLRPRYQPRHSISCFMLLTYARPTR